jgi:AraC-like DNA-binding protein
MRIARKSPADRSLAYRDRVNRAIDYILQHLAAPLRLAVVAQAAGFSPFHFHRIFRVHVGESVAEFVKRVRLERALVLLTGKDWPVRPRASLTDIAFACGFASSSDFSRCFRQRYGVAPRAFDVEAFRLHRRAEWLNASTDPRERLMVQRLPRGANPDGFTVQLRRLPARHARTSAWRIPFGREPSPPPPRASCPGPNNADSRMASGSATCGTTRKSSRPSGAATIWRLKSRNRCAPMAWVT